MVRSCQLRSSPHAVIFVAMVLTLLALLGRVAYLGRPVNSDTAMFVYMGQMVDHGARVGIDLLDNKLPTVGLLMAVPARVCGAAWSRYVWLGLCLTFAASVVLARAAGRTIGEDRFWPIFIASMVWLNFCPAVFGHLSLETIEVLFTCIAGAAAMQFVSQDDYRDAALVGLSAGVAMWAKPTAGAVLGAFVLMVAADRNRSMTQKSFAIALAALGASVPLAVAAFLLRTTGMLAGIPNSLHQIAEYARGAEFGWVDALKPVIVLAILAIPVLIARRFERSRGRQQTGSRSIIVFAVLWLVLETIAVIAQRRMYAYHFLVLGPPAALCLGMICHQPAARTLAAIFALPLTLSLAMAVSVPTQNDPVGNISARLAAVAGTGDVVWMDDYPRLLVEHDWRPGSRVPMIFLFANSDAAPLRFSEQILQDFSQAPPAFIVWPTQANRLTNLYQHHMAEIASFPLRSAEFAAAIARLDAYVHANYHTVATVGPQQVFKRDDTSSRQAALPIEDDEFPPER